MKALDLLKLVGGVHPLLGLAASIMSASPKTKGIADDLQAVLTNKELTSEDIVRIEQASAEVEIAFSRDSAAKFVSSEESQRAYVKGFVAVQGLFAKTALFLVVFARQLGFYVFWFAWAVVPVGVVLDRIGTDEIGLLAAYIGTAIPVILYQTNRRTREKKGGYASGWQAK